MNQARLPRSYLFVPGNRPERFDKAIASGADAVIIDLEDAVPPDQRESARATVSGWLTSDKPVVLRINSVETPWFADDLAICRNAGVAAVMLAKTQRARDLQAVGAGIALVPLIESAAGFDQLAAIAAVEGVQRLAFGAIDFQIDMNMRGGREELLFFARSLHLRRASPGLHYRLTVRAPRSTCRMRSRRRHNMLDAADLAPSCAFIPCKSNPSIAASPRMKLRSHGLNASWRFLNQATARL